MIDTDTPTLTMDLENQSSEIANANIDSLRSTPQLHLQHHQQPLIDQQQISNNNRRNLELRYQQCKSAYVGSVTANLARPQSARHNLEKYRKDAILEHQRRLLQQQYEQQQQQKQQEEEQQMEIKQQQKTNSMNDDQQNDDLDSLEDLLIREDEDSSSECESLNNENHATNEISYNTNNNINNSKVQSNKAQQNKNTMNNKKNSKLLALRNSTSTTLPGGNGSNQQTKKASINSLMNGSSSTINNNTSVNIVTTNSANSSSKFNQYTTFRPTAVTTTYQTPTSTTGVNHNNPLSNNTNLIVNRQGSSTVGHPNRTVVRLVESPSNTIVLYPATRSNDVGELNYETRINETLMANNSNIQTQAQIGSANNSQPSSTTISSSSSSSTSSKQQKLIHLNKITNEHEFTNIDDSNELINNNTNSNENEYNPNSDYIGDYNTNKNNININSSHNANARRRLQNAYNSNTNVILNGRTSRFSDYSSQNIPSQPHQQQLLQNGSGSYLLNRERSTVQVDPWQKRNPTLVAQNVLLKHKAELEQLASASRNNNPSQISNLSNMIPNSATTTNSNKYLLPNNNKIYKK